jgi:hypothetical protein
MTPGQDTTSLEAPNSPPSTSWLPPLAKALPIAFTLMSLAGVVAANSVWLPLEVQAAGHAFVNIVGQDVRWNMFSADPRGVDLDLWAAIEYTDGTTTTWTIDRNVLGGDLQYYRFVQWAESAVLLTSEDDLGGLAGWLATETTKPIARITIFGSQRDPSQPGTPRPQPRVEILLDVDASALHDLANPNG